MLRNKHNYLLGYQIFFISFLCSFFLLLQSSPGDLDLSFNGTGIVTANIQHADGVNEAARAIVTDRFGNFVIAGTNGIDFVIARYTSDGKLDTTFHSPYGYVITDFGGDNNIAYALALDMHNNIIAVGTDGNNFVIARYTDQGNLDRSFGFNGIVTTQIGESLTSIAYAVAVDSNNKIIAAGTDGANFVVARYTAQGDLDRSFGIDGIVVTKLGAASTAYALVIQPDGKIVVVGSRGNDYAVVRYLSNGNLDTVAHGGSGFGASVASAAPGYVITNISGADIGYSVALQSDGKIVVAGKSGSSCSLARYTIVGVLDTTFNKTGKVTTNFSGSAVAYAVRIQFDGKIVIAGSSKNNLLIAQYTKSGGLDTTFAAGLGYVKTDINSHAVAYGLAMTTAGNFVIAGTDGTNILLAAYTNNGFLYNAEFNYPKGYLTTNISIGSCDGAKATAVQQDGKIIAVGVAGNNMTLMRYTIDGKLDPTFGYNGIVIASIGTASIGYAIAIQVDGKIVVAGAAATSGLKPNRCMVARYTVSGKLDISFNGTGYTLTNIGGTSIAYNMLLDRSGRIVVTGESSKHIFVARYLSTGLLDTVANKGMGFGSGKVACGYSKTSVGATDVGYGLALTPSDKIVITGVTVNSKNSNFITLQYTSAGLLDTASFGSGLGYVITDFGDVDIAYAGAVISDGNIIVGGTSNNNFVLVQYLPQGVLNKAFGLGAGYTFIDFFHDVDRAYALAVQYDGKILISGTSAGNFAIARCSLDGQLDPTFGKEGKVITTIFSSHQASSVGLCLQPNGRILLCGTTSSYNGDFVLVRYIGDPCPPGVVDATYQSHGYVPYPAGGTALYNSQVTGLQIDKEDAVYVLCQDRETTMQSRLSKLDTDGVLAIPPITIPQSGACDLIQDSQQNILVVGTDHMSQRGWMRRYIATHSFISDVTFGLSGLVIGSYSSSFKRIVQQSSGQLIVMGQHATSNTGILAAYNQYGELNVAYFGMSGLYSIPSVTLSDIVVGSDDGIYVTYQSSTTIKINKIKADGSGLHAEYNFGNPIDTGLATFLYGMPYIALDNEGRLIFAAASHLTHAIVLQRYTKSGVLESCTNLLYSTSLLLSPILKQLQCDTHNRPIFIGYTVDGNFIGRVKNNILDGLDTVFAPYSLSPGILKINYDNENPTEVVIPKRSLSALAITRQGDYIVGGYDAMTTSTSIPYITRVTGDSNVCCQVPRYASQTVGGVDYSFGNQGTLSFNHICSCGQIKAIDILDDGKILAAIDTGFSTVIVRLNMDYTLDQTFGLGLGYITLSFMADVQTSMCDHVGDIYVIAQTHGDEDMYDIAKIAKDGSSIIWKTNTGCTLGKIIREQATGRIICNGSKDNKGIILAINPYTGKIDQFFGNNLLMNAGYYQKNDVSWIGQIGIIDNIFQKIIFGYRNKKKQIIVECLHGNGSLLDTAFTFGTPISDVVADDQICIVFDVHGKIVVVAKTNIGFVASRYDASGRDDIVNVPIHVANPAMCTLQNIVPLSDGSTLILGTNHSDNQLIVARLNSSFALDINFNTTGIFQNKIPFMTKFYDIDAAEILNNNIVIAGANSASQPSLMNIYNVDDIKYVYQNAASLVVPGTIDPTLQRVVKSNFRDIGDVYGYLNLHTDLSVDLPYSQATTLRLNSMDDSYYIGATDGTHSYVTYIDGFTDLQVAAFGSLGIVIIEDKPNVNNLYLSSFNTLYVVGGIGSVGANAGWIEQYTADNGNTIASFQPTDVLDSHYVCAMQSFSRVLVAGQEDGIGTIIAYDPETGNVDRSFNATGRYATGFNSPITGMLVGQDDAIYIVTNQGANAVVQKLSINGSLVWTNDLIIAASGNALNNHLVIDINHNIICIGVNTVTSTIAIKVYDQIDGTILSTLYLSQATTGFMNPQLKACTIDIDNKLVFVGYDDISNQITFVVRIAADMSGLDITFNSSGMIPGIQSYVIEPSNTIRSWNDVHINGQGKISVVGFVEIVGSGDTPYFTRFFGDSYISEYKVNISPQSFGILDSAFAASGTFDIGSLDSLLDNTAAMGVKTLDDGTSYVACDDMVTYSYLAKLTNARTPTLDITFHTTGIADTAPYGVKNIYQDAAGRIILCGANSEGGWVQRYTSNGVKDTTFGSLGIITAQMSYCAALAEQTSGRYLVVGRSLSDGHGVVRAYTPNGEVDTTFHSQGIVPGEYKLSVAHGIYSLCVDQYDRIYIAYKNGFNVDVARLTSDGNLDSQFGASNGILSSALTYSDEETQIRLAVDIFDNVVIAAHIFDTTNKIAVLTYNANGTMPLYTQINIDSFVEPVLTNFITNSSGRIILTGYQSGNNPMWIVQLLPGGQFDTLFGVSENGIMYFNVAVASQTIRALQAVAIQLDNSLFAVGYEQVGGISSPFIASVTDFPYQYQVALSPGSQAFGTNDTTLGASSTTATNLGVTFFSSATANAASGQVARAVALQDDAHILVAVDGGSAAGSATPSNIFLKMFGIDGVADATFGTSGQQTVLTTYQNQFVKDMVTFTTVAGVHKAILAGYVTNSTLSSTSSLLLQYNLDTHLLDSSFGGFDGDAAGIAFGDGKQLFAVGQQSSGRIIGSGVSQDNLGLLLGYTSAGKLDSSFGNNGYLLQSDATGINTHAIDTQNRICIGYKDADNQAIIARVLSDGSALDTSFNTTGAVNTLQTTYSNDGIRVAVDASNNVYAAVVADNYSSVTLYAYNEADGTDLYVAFTPSLSLTHFEISKLLIDVDGNVTIVGYDTNGGSADQIIIARVLADLSALDTSFNATGAIPGCLKYAVAAGTTQVTTDALIHPDGRIIIVGSEN